MYFKSLLIVAVLFFVSCKKKTPDDVAAPSILENGLLVLNEGLFQQNNSTLSFVNTQNGGVNLSFFEEKSGRSLGDTGNDLARYGNKIYVIVNVSSTIEVLDAISGASIQQILMFQGTAAKQPRSIAFSDGKAFISCYDGFVDVLDTATLSITQRVPVGSNPEGIAVSNGKVYVANSGGLNFPNVDSTVSVIQISTLQEIKRITIGNNPGSICVDNQGDVYAISRGNYGTIPSRMHRIDPITDTKVQSFPFDASGIERMNSDLIISYFNTTTQSSAIALFNSITETISNPNFIATTGIATLYGITYSTKTNKIYCCDANGYSTTGYVNVFNAAGIFETRYHVGLNPSKVIAF